jgi:hypothetical protein
MDCSGKLKEKVALVAGATRGAGRGIACMLWETGVTGRQPWEYGFTNVDCSQLVWCY